MGKKMQRRTTAGLGVAAGAGAAVLFSLGNAPLAGAQPDDTFLQNVLDPQTQQFEAFSSNITDNLGTSVAGDNAIFGEYLGALPNVGNTAALNGLDEVSGQLNDQLANTNANDLNGFQDVLSADHSDAFGGAGFPAVPASSVSDVLNANTDQFTAFSNNLTDNLGISGGADSAIYGDYLGALPNVGNTAALNGLDEVSGQLNDQLANTNANDVNGLVDVLNAGNNVANIGGTGGVDENASVADIQAALSNAGLTNSDFSGGSLHDAAVALAANSHTDELGDSVNPGSLAGPDTGVFAALQDAGITALGQHPDQAIADALNSASGGEGTGLTDPALSDALAVQTLQFTALSNNLTGNLNAVGNGDVGIFSDYLNALPNVGNTAALNGLDEVSGQLNDQLANANATDVAGFGDVLNGDFTNLGDFLNLGDFAGI
jgi:hypothetical protein